EAADRKRREAEERNARHRRTRELRAELDRAGVESASADEELTSVTEQLADPAVYADATRVRQLVERHNQLRDRADALAAERRRLSDELAAAEADPALAAR
ncbi:MAG: hypothetical protein M3Y40_06035, partial [Chloroflexota bacterium]|nr:hypothetical protein [Chloroflexota bacterium]